MNIGDLVVEPISDGVLKAPATAFKGTTEESWAPHRRFLDPDGMLAFALGGFLVRAPGDRLVLVDAGVGPGSGAIMGGTGQYTGGELLDSMAAHTVRPEDITDVVFTHLHFDHVGWASLDGARVFPNATYRCDARDWAHFRENERVRPILAPIEDRLTTWDGSGPLTPGVDTMSAPGHTPGSTIIVLSSGAARGLLLGDVVHCPVELLDDEWTGLGDVDPQLAKRTRNALAREIEGTDTPVAAAHFPGMVFGRLLAANGRRSWVVP
ncbi:MAG TPA: MBL fold metallo-hydrolase [Chloroflexota bacterium]|nr:MBL fold metallo-hydrolase [Chloroflexota bacterium]